MIDYLSEQLHFLLAELEGHGKFIAHIVDGFHELLADLEQDNASWAECGEEKSETSEVEF